MACNCGKRAIQRVDPRTILNKNKRSVPAIPSRRNPVNPPPRAPSSPPRQKQMMRFCNKCGWMIRKVRYTDPGTSIIVEKSVCTNRNCPNYNREV